jgi:RNA polymerase subunit RPABC4/transcription elongation factor Spt4
VIFLENNINDKIIHINSCSSCGKVLKDEWGFCPFCKTPVEVFNCHFCKREIRTSWSFCPYCINEVRETDKQAHKVDMGNEWLRSILKK